MRSPLSFTPFAALLLTACGSGSTGDSPSNDWPTLNEDCNPLDDTACSYPYPSMAFLAEDSSTGTGYRVSWSADTLGYQGTLPNRDALAVFLNRADGFPIGTPMLAQIGGDVEVDGDTLPSFSDLAASVEATSSVQVLDADGKRIPLWAELDRRAPSAERRSLMIRPQVGLQTNTRYTVVITDAVRAADGGALEPEPVYAALRDGTASDDADVEALRDLYEGIFSFLEEHGVDRERTLLAWQFHTFSDEHAQSLALPHVETARGALQAPDDVPCPSEGACPDLLSYTIVECLTSDADDALVTGCTFDETLHPDTFRSIRGTFTVPFFVDEETGVITTDTSGAPELVGRGQAEFTVHVPTSLRAQSAGTAPLLVFGHGLLAKAEDYIAERTNSHGVLDLTNRMDAIAIGTRWTGLSEGDEFVILSAIADGAEIQPWTDGLVQSMVSTTLLPRFVWDSFASYEGLAATDESGSLLDPSRVYYYGISQGSIFGTTFMALSPDVKSGALHVPTSMYVNVLQHSDLFGPFQDILATVFPDTVDQQIFLAQFQSAFDPLDPINYVRYTREDAALTALGQKNLLWQCSWGDSSAPDFNAYAMARTIDAPLPANSPREVYGLTEIALPTAPNTTAFAIFDPGLGRRSLDNANTPSVPGTDAHQAIRRNDEVLEQIVGYFSAGEEGTVIDTCNGECTVTPVPREGEGTYPPQ